VEGNYRGRGRWYPGKVVRVRLDGTCDVDYDDGEKEQSVARDLVRTLGGSAGTHSPRSSSGRVRRLEVGAKVEADYRGRGKWYPGKIARDRGDGTFDIDYDDGEKESRVEERMIRLVGAFVDDRGDRGGTSSALSVGDKVRDIGVLLKHIISVSALRGRQFPIPHCTPLLISKFVFNYEFTSLSLSQHL
jgi:hypothetical protein